MLKKTLGIALSVGMFLVSVPAFAATTSSASVVTPTKNDMAQITCVGSAVNTRESALDAGIASLTQAQVAAYSARASALKQAYTQSSKDSVKTASKTAWSTFNSSMKSARTSWQSARKSAWSDFTTSVKACKAPSVSTDASNANSESNGQ